MERPSPNPFRHGRAWVFLVMLALTVIACDPAPRDQSVVLVTLDTARVDLLSAYGGHGVTPRLDALAARAVRFDRAFTTAPYTGPSHASLLTGQNPPRHGLRDYLKQALPDDAATLAEILRERGYDTAAFVSAYVLDPRFGLDQGFEVYSSPERSAERGGHWRPGPRTVALALEWLRERDPARPFLLWVHLYDAHGPYMPPARYRKALPRGVRPGSLDARRQRYYEQAAVLDDAVGHLLDALEAHGHDPILVVVSDHGELLGEHGRKLGAHSNALVDATVRVPMLLRIPGHLEEGVRNERVSVIDVLPTILVALGLEVPDDVEGRSLLAPAAGSPPPAYSETFYEGFGRAADGKELASLREDRFVLLARPSRDELFDLSTDPGERIDVAMDHPERLAALRAELDRLRQTWSRSASQELDLNDAEREEHTNQLRALGYVQ